MALHETLARILSLPVYRYQHEPFANQMVPKRVLFVGKATRNAATLEGLVEKYGVEITIVIPQETSAALHAELRCAETMMAQHPTKIKLAVLATDLSGINSDDADAIFIDIMDDEQRLPFAREVWRVVKEGGWSAIRANLKSPIRTFKDLGMVDLRTINEESVWYGRIRKDESFYYPKAKK